jgi:hypothetical protein
MDDESECVSSQCALDRAAVVCHVCASEELVEISDGAIRGWVSSDSKPVKRGEPLAVCAHCGCVQKQQTDRWHQQVGEIYAGYSI